MKKLKLKDLSKDEFISREKLARIVGGDGPGDTTSIGDSTSITGPASLVATPVEHEKIHEVETDPAT